MALAEIQDFLFKLFLSKEDYREYRMEQIEKSLRAEYNTDPQTQTFNENTKETMYNLVRQWGIIRDYKQGGFLTKGFPTVSPDAVMAFYKRAIDKVRGASGMNPENQKAYLLPAIRKLVHSVHLIPASSSYHHSGPGGLFEHSLELAYYAATAAKGKIFEKYDLVTKERIPNSKWEMAVILCSLFHDIGKVVTDVTIRNWNKTAVFTPHSSLLWDWILRNPGDTYYVYWNGTGKDHEKAMLALLKFNLFPLETAHWLGETICREIDSFLQSGGKDSVFAKIIENADMRSTAEDRKMGQWDYRIESGVDRQLHNVLTAFKRLLYASTQSSDQTGRPLPIHTEKDNVVTGWDCNYPDSALLYPDHKHLFIRWDRLLDVRLMMEEFNSGRTLFDFSIKTKDLSDNEKEEERLKVARTLQQSNYLEKPLSESHAMNGGRREVWRVFPIDRKTGEILDAVGCICLNKSAQEELFRDRDWPAADSKVCQIEQPLPDSLKTKGDKEEAWISQTDNSKDKTQNVSPTLVVDAIQGISEGKETKASSIEDRQSLATAELNSASKGKSGPDDSFISKSPVGQSSGTQASDPKGPDQSTGVAKKPEDGSGKEGVNLANLGKMKSIGGSEQSNLATHSSEDKPRSAFGLISPTSSRKPKLFPAYGKTNKTNEVLSDCGAQKRKSAPVQVGDLKNLLESGRGELTKAQLDATLSTLLPSGKKRVKAQIPPEKELVNRQGPSGKAPVSPQLQETKVSVQKGDRPKDDQDSNYLISRTPLNGKPDSDNVYSQKKSESHLNSQDLSRDGQVAAPLVVPMDDDDEIEEERPLIPTSKVDVKYLGDKRSILSEKEFVKMLIKELSRQDSILTIKEDRQGRYVGYEEVEALAREHQTSLLAIKRESRRLQNNSRTWIRFDLQSDKVRLMPMIGFGKSWDE